MSSRTEIVVLLAAPAPVEAELARGLLEEAGIPSMLHGPDMDDLSGFTYTFTYNLTGWPGAVVRAGTSPEGLPIGVQIVARPGREDVALAIAKRVESDFGGYQRPDL